MGNSVSTAQLLTLTFSLSTFKSAFGRLRVPMSPNHSRRELLLRVCVRLHNLRARRVRNVNQLRTVYGQVFDWDKNRFRDRVVAFYRD